MISNQASAVLDITNAASNQTSGTFDLMGATVVCMNGVGLTGAATGVCKLQGTNFPSGKEAWVDIASATLTLTSSTPVAVTVSSVGFRYARFVYTAGGTGTAKVVLFGKN